MVVELQLALVTGGELQLTNNLGFGYMTFAGQIVRPAPTPLKYGAEMG